MNRTLVLMRHAKSDWGDPGLDDHDRPLNARGRAAAPVMARALAARGIRPAIVICSTALRTRETLGLMRPAFGALEIRFADALYHAAPETLLDTVHALPPAAETAMLVGHNPGLEDFAKGFARLPETDDEREALIRLSGKYPTAAAAIFRLNEDWRAARMGTGRLELFLRPRDLAADG